MWITTGVPHELLRQVEEEMEGLSHRAAAVVGGAFVEEHLTHVLQSRMVRDEKVIEKRFAAGRAFGDFGAKIDLGYLIGVYSKQAYKELTTIRRIRNDFAHQLEVNSFDRDDMRDKAHPVVPGSPICGMRMPCGGRLRRAREGIEWLRAISVSTVPRGPKGRRTATGMPTSGSRHPKTGNPAPSQIWPATPIC
jgi:hypothetical protein